LRPQHDLNALPSTAAIGSAGRPTIDALTMLGAENLSLHYSTVPIGFDASGAGQSPILIWGEREMSNPDRTLDAKTLYNATQTEMNSRLQIGAVTGTMPV
jgi:hypothetical protein